MCTRAVVIGIWSEYELKKHCNAQAVYLTSTWSYGFIYHRRSSWLGNLTSCQCHHPGWGEWSRSAIAGSATDMSEADTTIESPRHPARNHFSSSGSCSCLSSTFGLMPAVEGLWDLAWVTTLKVWFSVQLHKTCPSTSTRRVMTNAQAQTLPCLV